MGNPLWYICGVADGGVRLSRELLDLVASYAFREVSDMDIGVAGGNLEAELWKALRALQELEPDLLGRVLGRLSGSESVASQVVAALNASGPGAEWRAVGVVDPLEVAAWEVYDASPGEAAEWLRSGLSVNDFYSWGEWFSARDVAVYKAAGLEVSDWPCGDMSAVSKFDAQLILDVKDFPQVGGSTDRLLDAALWREYLGGAFTPDTYDAFMAVDRFVPPNSVAEWEMAPEEILGWCRKGYGVASAKKMVGEGFDCESAPMASLNECAAVNPTMAAILGGAREHGWRVARPWAPLAAAWDRPWVRLVAPTGYAYKLYCDKDGFPRWVQVFDGGQFVGVLDENVDFVSVFDGNPWGKGQREPFTAKMVRRLCGDGWKVRVDGVSYRRPSDDSRTRALPVTVARAVRDRKGFELSFPSQRGWVVVGGRSDGHRPRRFTSAADALRHIVNNYVP